MLDGLKLWAERGSQFASVLYSTLVEDRGELASPDTVQRRLVLCRSCPRFDERRNRCTVCGCKVDDVAGKGLIGKLTNKIAHKASRCPAKRWGAEGDIDMSELEKLRAEAVLTGLRDAIAKARVRLLEIPDRLTAMEQEKTRLESMIAEQTARLAELEGGGPSPDQ